MPHSTYSGTRLFFLHLGLHPNSPSNPGAIKTCLTNGEDLHEVVSDLSTHPDGIVVDSATSHIYYSNMGPNPSAADGSITRVDMDGGNSTEIIGVPNDAGSSYTPKQLTIVPEQGRRGSAGKLYWCDREGGRVWRADSDGGDVQCLYASDTRVPEAKVAETDRCVGIAVDQKHGQIFWTQKGPTKGGEGRLFSAALEIPEGETAETRSDVKILMDNLPEPIDLEYDEETNLLYKTDRGAPPEGNKVSRLHFDKKGAVAKEEVLVDGLHDAIGLSLNKKTQKMYFTDIGGSVYEADMNGGNKKEILKNQGDLTGIKCVNFD